MSSLILALTVLTQAPSPQGVYGFSPPPAPPSITSVTIPVEVRYRPTWRLRSPLERGLKPVLTSAPVWTAPVAQAAPVFASAPPLPALPLAAPVKAAPQSFQATATGEPEILEALRKISDRLDRLEAVKDPWKASAPPIPSH